MLSENKAFLFFIFFIAGIFAAGFKISLLAILIANAMASLIFIFAHVLNPKRRLITVGFLILAVFAGAFYARAYEFKNFGNSSVAFGKNTRISGTVVSVPQNYIKSQSFEMKTDNNLILSVRVSYYELLSYGDRITVLGTAEPLSTSTEYMKKNGIVGTLNYPKIISQNKNQNFSFQGALYSIRESISDVYKTTLNKDQSSLMAGILLGQESADFSADFKQSMKNSGTTHITALSGYNITILISALFYILSFAFSRRLTFWAALAGIILFVVMTGAQSSVIRAAIMGSLVIVAQRLSRIYDFKQAMAASAFLMLLANPLILKFDLGFVLSFLSLAGITYLAPSISVHLKAKADWLEKLKKLFCETLSAQLAVLPLLSAYFGGFSLAGLVSNLIILPMIPITMLLGFIHGIAGIVWMPLARIFSIVVSVPLSVESGLIRLFGKIPQIGVEFGVTAIIIYYATLILYVVKSSGRVKANEYIV